MIALRPSTYWEEVEEGQALPSVIRRPHEVQLFLYNAVIWNPHRIHYDRDHATAGGLPDLVVQGHLQGAWLSQSVTDWIGPLGRMKRLRWQHRRPASVGQALVFKGRVTRKYQEDGECLVDGEVWEESEEGQVLVPGHFTAALPQRHR